jgi:hypothetical protein
VVARIYKKGAKWKKRKRAGNEIKNKKPKEETKQKKIERNNKKKKKQYKRERKETTFTSPSFDFPPHLFSIPEYLTRHLSFFVASL